MLWMSPSFQFIISPMVRLLLRCSFPPLILELDSAYPRTRTRRTTWRTWIFMVLGSYVLTLTTSSLNIKNLSSVQVHTGGIYHYTLSGLTGICVYTLWCIELDCHRLRMRSNLGVHARRCSCVAHQTHTCMHGQTCTQVFGIWPYTDGLGFSRGGIFVNNRNI